MRTDTADLQRSYLDAAYRRDGWLWITQQAKTFDEHDPGAGAKPFPVEKQYLEEGYRIWQKYAFTIEEKSRQMLETWRVICSHVHLAQFNTFTRVLLASKDEDDTLKLLDRAEFVYDNQAPWLKELYPAKRTGNVLQFYHKINGKMRKSSVIEALAKGGDETRSMVGSAVVLDEAAFVEYFEAFLTACIPMTVTGKIEEDPSKPKSGRITILSTANPGPFQAAVEETKKRAKRREVVLSGMDLEGRDCDGLTVWHPQYLNDFACIRLHYSADPAIAAKVREARRKYEALGALPAYRKEYDIDYDALSGELIWPSLSKQLHQIPADFVIPADWARFRVIDPGWDNACAVLWIAVSPEGWRGCADETGRRLSVLVVYREFYDRHKRVDEVYREIIRLSGSEHYTVTLIDPSSDIHKGNEHAGMSIYEKFVDLGIRPLVKANNAVEAGLDEVRLRLAVHSKSPALLIKSDCVKTWEECTKYHYKQKALTAASPTEPTPFKKNDHTCDALRYGCQYRQMPKKAEKPKNPMKSFGWHVERMAEERRWGSLLGNGNFATGRILA